MYPSAVPDPPRRSRLAALAPWRAALLALGAGGVALSAILVPPYLIGARIDDVLWRQIATGVLAAGWAAIGTVGWLRLNDLDPHGCFVTRPDRTLLPWCGLGFGLAGVVLAASMFDAGLTVSVASFAPGSVSVRLLAAIATGAWSGTVEELLVRGVILGVLGARWRWDGAVLATALLFGLLHVGAGSSPAATAAYVTVTTVAGILLGLIVIARESVWCAVALHAAWNASFAHPFLAMDAAADVPAIVTFHGEPGWLLGAGGTAPPESPLAILLFAVVLCGYWMSSRRPPDGD